LFFWYKKTMGLSANGKNNTDLKWSKYSPESDFFELKSENNLQELVVISYKEKQIRKLIQYTWLFCFYRVCYYTWNIWRWFTPEFYEKLRTAFILSQTEQEEITFKGWVAYLVRTKPRQLRQNFQESRIKIIDNWTIETTIRILVFLFGIIIGCLQASYLRYSFLSDENKSSYSNLSWQDFKIKQPIGSLENKKLIFYDKFIVISANDGLVNYCVNLPATLSNKNIFSTLKKMVKRPVGKKLFNTPIAEKETIKLKKQYKRNIFRHLRTRAVGNNIKLPEMTFYHDPRDFYSGAVSSLSFLVYLYAVLFPFWFLGNSWYRMTTIAIDIRKTKAKKVIKSQNKKRFSDLAGIEQLLPDLNDLVQSLHSKKTKANNLSIYAPKGYLLVGPPGTGKTLLAQAIAGESKVTFFFTSASEFIENQNGIGPTRLRDLFRKAKKESPAIIFIDEIDTLGKRRAGSVTSLNTIENGQQGEEKIQILTEFLIQMDGFSKRTDLIVIGATNFFDLLDPAFIRPGRFDRIFQLELPTKAVRIDILKLHSSKKGFDSSVPWNYFGRSTSGFSGADLSAMVNESLLKIIRDKRTSHTLETLQHGLERISTYSKNTTLAKADDIYRKSYYQAGIGLIYSLVKELPNQLSLELEPRAKNLRYSKLEKKIETFNFEISNKQILKAQILGCLAGICSEAFVFTDPFFGLSQQGVNDLEKATQIAITMIDSYGMFGYSRLAIAYNPFDMNSSAKRFNYLESYSYDQVWYSIQDDFFRLINEEEDREKPIRMNWRFLSFWAWQLTSQNLYTKSVPKWGKSYIGEKTQEDQEILLGDDYFHKNQVVEYKTNFYGERDRFIRTFLLQSFIEVEGYYERFPDLLDLIALELRLKGRLIEDEILDLILQQVDLPDQTVENEKQFVEDLIKNKK
jgi:cell division protease FtsH